MKTFKPLLTAVFALVAITSTGCMMSPLNGERMESTTEPVEFYGYTLDPEATIELQAKWPHNGQWYAFETVTSDDGAYEASGTCGSHRSDCVACHSLSEKTRWIVEGSLLCDLLFAIDR